MKMQTEVSIVDRVDCPACHQRKYQTDDCICCGGLGIVDTEYVQSIVEQTLIDIDNGNDRASKQSWLSPGLYPFDNGKWYLMNHDRFVHEITEKEANELLYADYPFILDVFFADVRECITRLANWLCQIFRKPIL